MQGVSRPSTERQGKRLERSDETAFAYTQTKVVHVNPEILRDNKITAWSHEGEMPKRVKMLRTQIEHKMEELNGSTLLITSTHPSEGKTFTAINLALAFAQAVARTVLLVDADLRKPSIHEILGLEAGQGLSDYLLGQVELPDVLVNPGIARLVVLPAGTQMPNSTELLSSPRMGSLVAELKHRYSNRFIIFDGSSLLASADPLAFSPYIDGFLLVVESEKTSREDFHRAKKLLEGKPLLGSVFNKTSPA
jgi:non-specific protein-tyrosine kinase